MLKIKESFFLGLFSLLFFTSSEAKADKIRILNISKIMNVCQAAVKAREFLDVHRKVYYEEIEKKEEKIRQLHKELEEIQHKDREEFERRRKDFEEKFLEVKNQFQRYKSELEFIHQNSLDLIHKKAMDITLRIRQKENIKVILPAESVIDHEVDLDITEQVLKELNEVLPSVDIQSLKSQFEKSSQDR